MSKRRDPLVSEAVGKRIRARREQLGVSLTKIAKQLGVTKSAVSQWELGGSNMLADHLLRLAVILDANPFELAGIDEARVPTLELDPSSLAKALEVVDRLTEISHRRLSHKAKAKLLLYLTAIDGEYPNEKELARLIALAN